MTMALDSSHFESIVSVAERKPEYDIPQQHLCTRYLTTGVIIAFMLWSCICTPTRRYQDSIGHNSDLHDELCTFSH
jgi:hypothetical protein